MNCILVMANSLLQCTICVSVFTAIISAGFDPYVLIFGDSEYVFGPSFQYLRRCVKSLIKPVHNT